jgi:hypothetical protein
LAGRVRAARFSLAAQTAEEFLESLDRFADLAGQAVAPAQAAD